MKTLFIITFLFVSSLAYGQNYLGVNRTKLDSLLNRNTNISRIKEIIENDSITYNVRYKDDPSSLYCYLIVNDKCQKYAIVCCDYSQLNDLMIQFLDRCVKISEYVWMDYGKRNIKWEIEKQEKCFIFSGTYVEN